MLSSHRILTFSAPRLRRAVPDIVAFTDRIHSQKDNLNIGVTIVFDSVLLNEGNGYHSNHGIFIAPVTVLYVLSVSIVHILDANYVKVILVKMVAQKRQHPAMQIQEKRDKDLSQC